MGRPKAPLGLCETCGAAFTQKRRGKDRERRCPPCVREWRWSQRRLQRLPKAESEIGGELWPDLVAAELAKGDR
jgi:hypothetical protein